MVLHQESNYRGRYIVVAGAGPQIDRARELSERQIGRKPNGLLGWCVCVSFIMIIIVIIPPRHLARRGQVGGAPSEWPAARHRCTFARLLALGQPAGQLASQSEEEKKLVAQGD